MRIVVQGTHERKNNATEVAGLLASLSAIKNAQKTIVLQVTGARFPSVLECLVGKKLEANTIKKLGEINTANMKGIDALLRNIGVTALSLENFNSSVESLIPDHENLLDVAKQTDKDSFFVEEDNDENAEQIITSQDIISLIEQSDNFYDNIIVLLDGKDNAFNNEILEAADTVITCIKQANPVETYNKLENTKKEKKNALENSSDLVKHEYLMVTDFFSESRFSKKNIQNRYGKAKMLILPFDVNRRDSVHEGTFFRYVKQTLSSSNNDDNVFYEECVGKITDVVFGNEQHDPINWASAGILENQITQQEEVKPLQNVAVEEKIKEKGFFFKKKEKSIQLKKETATVQEKSKSKEPSAEKKSSNKSFQKKADPQSVGNDFLKTLEKEIFEEPTQKEKEDDNELLKGKKQVKKEKRNKTLKAERKASDVAEKKPVPLKKAAKKPSGKTVKELAEKYNVSPQKIVSTLKKAAIEDYTMFEGAKLYSYDSERKMAKYLKQECDKAKKPKVVAETKSTTATKPKKSITKGKKALPEIDI